MPLNDLISGHMAVFGIEIGLVPRIVIAIVAALFAWFIIHYFLRGVFFLVRGKLLVRKIRKLHAANKDVAPEDVRGLMKPKTVWAHLWSEYEEWRPTMSR